MLAIRAAGVFAAAGALLVLASLLTTARADKVIAKSGMQFEGRYAQVSGMAETPDTAKGGDPVGNRLVVLVDDDLRRTFLSKYQVQSYTPSNEPLVSFKLDQRIAKSGQRVASVGQILRADPFDPWGRRTLTMNMGGKGAVDIVQGITEITPLWTKAEGMLGSANFTWDMRIATTSIPRQTLSEIFKKYLKQDNAQVRLQIVKFYIQSDRFEDARAELEQAIKDFPGLAHLKKELSENTQAGARRMLKEIDLRIKAGQFVFAQRLLEKFPSEEVAGETLLKVGEMLGDFKKKKEKGEGALKKLDELIAKITEEKTKAAIAPVREEIGKELNFTTLDRLADFIRLENNEAMTPEQRVSLAVSGWLFAVGGGGPKEVGPEVARDNLAVSLAAFEVRNLIREYLGGAARPRRTEIVKELAAHEGSSPAYLAKLIKAMKPPLPPDPQEADPNVPGLFTLKVPGLAEDKDFVYHVQLPPEYDPYRRYPAVVTLAGGGTTAMQQVDWWAGAWSPKLQMRVGQATRRGYIVIAPEWKRQHQSQYEYSPREHAAVLNTLRDACRRFSIDSDRVYLSGHSMGGDAAWDIALAHPDLFAGTMPIVAESDKFVARYWENARHTPLYFVGGSLDGDKLAKNSRDWDRYLKGAGFDCTIVEYLGRGHEHFIDEIQRLCDWMDLHERNFFPASFKVLSMREGDSFFWWVEIDQMPPNNLVNHVNWPPPARARPTETAGEIHRDTNVVQVTTGAARATLYFAPEMVDMTKPISVRLNTKTTRVNPTPTAETLLEDVRTRGDRQHPFWFKVAL